MRKLKAMLAKDCPAFNITDSSLERTCSGDCQIFFSKKRRAVTLRATAISSEQSISMSLSV